MRFDREVNAMNITRRASRVVVGTLDAATSTVGALGGAAVGAVTGGVRGSAVGLRDGLVDGSHSTPAALVTLGTLGAVGLVEWPVILGVGTVALLVRYLRHDDQPAATVLGPKASGTAPASPTPIRSATPAKRPATKSTATKATPAKAKAASGTAKATPAKAAPRKAAARTGSRSRRTPAKP